jgi:hypothetical protein
MSRLFSFLAMATLILLVGSASAERVPSSKALSPQPINPSHNVFVPYTTNGFSTLGVYQGVSPYIYSRPSLNDRTNHGVMGVYNLPFYGAKLSSNSNNNGATPGNQALQPRRR